MPVRAPLALSSQDRLFLRAATGQRADAVEAWLQITREVDLDSPNPEQFGVLPLLYKNLSRHSVEHREIQRLKGIYKYMWVQNQMRLFLLAEVVAKLQSESAELRAAGDAALAAGPYHDSGARPIRSLRVEVADRVQAERLLAGLGWQPNGGRAEQVRFVRQYHRTGMVRLELGCLRPGESGLVEEGGSVRLSGRMVKIPGPSEQLLSVCVEAAARDGSALLGRAADFLVICGSTATIDWGWVRRVCRHQGCEPTLEALARLMEGRAGN